MAGTKDSPSSPLSNGDHYFTSSSDVRLHYRVNGVGPLFLLSSAGWGISAAFSWKLLGPILEEHFTVVYIEPRGNGRSSRPSDPEAMTNAIMADDLEALRLHLGVEAFPVVFGASNGAAIAIRYAQLHPSRVEKLIVADAELHDAPPSSNSQHWLAKRQDDPVYKEAAAQIVWLFANRENLGDSDEELWAKFRIALPYYFSDVKGASVMEKAMVDDEDEDKERGRVPMSAWTLKQTALVNQRPENKLQSIGEAGKITAKTLVIYGAEDPLCSPEGAKALAEAVPDSKLVFVENAGHIPPLDNPEQWWKEFMGFARV